MMMDLRPRINSAEFIGSGNRVSGQTPPRIGAFRASQEPGRFSPLVESPIVRDTVINAPGVFPMTDGAEEEMPPSQS